MGTHPGGDAQAPQQVKQIESIPIRVDQIRTEGGTQTRAALNQTTVDEYAEAMRAGASFPPLIVYYDGEHHWLADGFHRHAAAVEAGKATFPAEVRQGTRRDAVLCSAGANATHGLRPSPADRRRAVETLLHDDEWRRWSDHHIADRCHVDPKTVGNVRHELERSGEIPKVVARSAVRDGHAMTVDTSGIAAANAGRAQPGTGAETNGLQTQRGEEEAELEPGQQRECAGMSGKQDRSTLVDQPRDQLVPSGQGQQPIPVDLVEAGWRLERTNRGAWYGVHPRFGSTAWPKEGTIFTPQPTPEAAIAVARSLQAFPEELRRHRWELYRMREGWAANNRTHFTQVSPSAEEAAGEALAAQALLDAGWAIRTAPHLLSVARRRAAVEGAERRDERDERRHAVWWAERTEATVESVESVESAESAESAESRGRESPQGDRPTTIVRTAVLPTWDALWRAVCAGETHAGSVNPNTLDVLAPAAAQSLIPASAHDVAILPADLEQGGWRGQRRGRGRWVCEHPRFGSTAQHLTRWRPQHSLTEAIAVARALQAFPVALAARGWCLVRIRDGWVCALALDDGDGTPGGSGGGASGRDDDSGGNGQDEDEHEHEDVGLRMGRGSSSPLWVTPVRPSPAAAAREVEALLTLQEEGWELWSRRIERLATWYAWRTGAAAEEGASAARKAWTNETVQQVGGNRQAPAKAQEGAAADDPGSKDCVGTWRTREASLSWANVLLQVRQREVVQVLGPEDDALFSNASSPSASVASSAGSPRQAGSPGDRLLRHRLREAPRPRHLRRATLDRKQAKPGRMGALVPHALVVGEQLDAYTVPPLQRHAILWDVPEAHTIRLQGAGMDEHDTSRDHRNVWCLYDGADWERAQQMYTAFAAALSGLADALRSAGSYRQRLAEAGGYARLGAEPLTPTVIAATDPDGTHHGATRWLVPVCQRLATRRQTPQMIELDSDDALLRGLRHQQDHFVCLDDATWELVRAARAEAVRQAERWEWYLRELGTYADAASEYAAVHAEASEAAATTKARRAVGFASAANISLRLGAGARDKGEEGEGHDAADVTLDAALAAREVSGMSTAGDGSMLAPRPRLSGLESDAPDGDRRLGATTTSVAPSSDEMSDDLNALLPPDLREQGWQLERESWGRRYLSACNDAGGLSTQGYADAESVIAEMRLATRVGAVIRESIDAAPELLQRLVVLGLGEVEEALRLVAEELHQEATRLLCEHLWSEGSARQAQILLTLLQIDPATLPATIVDALCWHPTPGGPDGPGNSRPDSPTPSTLPSGGVIGETTTFT